MIRLIGDDEGEGEPQLHPSLGAAVSYHDEGSPPDESTCHVCEMHTLGSRRAGTLDNIY